MATDMHVQRKNVSGNFPYQSSQLLPKIQNEMETIPKQLWKLGKNIINMLPQLVLFKVKQNKKRNQ